MRKTPPTLTREIVVTLTIKTLAIIAMWFVFFRHAGDAPLTDAQVGAALLQNNSDAANVRETINDLR